MKVAITIGFVLGMLGIVFGCLGEPFLVPGAILFGASTIALAIIHRE